MKKLIYAFLICFIMIAFSIPSFAFVDRGVYPSYEVYIVNPSGAVLYSEDGKQLSESRVKRNTKFTVDRTAEIGSEEYVQYNDEGKYIKLSDVSPVKDSMDVDPVKLEQSKKIAVIKRDGLKMYQYPGEAYQSLATIPFGTKLVLEYGNGDNWYDLVWGYVTYNGTKGWINVSLNDSGENVGLCIEEGDGHSGKILITDKNVHLFSSPIDAVNFIVNGTRRNFVTEEIPVGTELEYDIYYSGNRNECACTEYKGTKGWIVISFGYHNTCIATEEDGYAYITDTNGAALFSDCGNGATVLKTIPQGSVVKTDYCSERLVCNSDGKQVFSGDEYNPEDVSLVYYYRVSFEGSTGWMSGDSLNLFDIKEYQNIGSDAAIYALADAQSTVIGTIPADGIYYCGYKSENELQNIEENDGFKLVKYDGIFGWIEADENDEAIHSENGYTTEELFDGYLNYLQNNSESETEQPTAEEAEIEMSEDIADTSMQTNSKAQSNKTVIIFACAVSVIVAIAVISFVAIKKKKTK